MSKLDHDPKVHQKHTVKPNTPDSQINRFMSRHKMVHCPNYNCTMTVGACRDRKKRAMLAKKIVAVNYRDLTMISQAYLELKHCVKCLGG